MSDYETGYRARVERSMTNEVEDHFTGYEKLDRSRDWFEGYEDACTDITAYKLGVNQMQFGLIPQEPK